MSLGSWKTDDIIDISATLHNPATSAITDATGLPAWRIYKQGTAAAIRTGTLTKRDSQTGFYTANETLSAANGYVKGFDYIIKITAVVSGVTGGIERHFQIEAEVDANVVSDKSGFSLSIAGILAIWHQLTSNIVTSGSIGKLIKDNLDAVISSIVARLPAALVSGRMDSNISAINDNSTAAIKLALSADRIIRGVVATGITPTVTDFSITLTDGIFSDTDHLKDRIIIFTTSGLSYQVAEITAHRTAPTPEEFTVTGMTRPPIVGEAFIIV